MGMPPIAAGAGQPAPNVPANAGGVQRGARRISGALGIAVIFVAGVLALAVLLQPWLWNRYVEVPAPPRSVVQQETQLREKLNNYEKSADQLKTLASLLLGLSALYAVSLGVASYLGIQDAKERADQAVERIGGLETTTRERLRDYESRLEAERKGFNERAEQEVLYIRGQFPLFRDMQESIRKLSENLHQFIPDGDFGRDIFTRIDDESRVMIEHFERAVGAFEFFDLTPFSKDAGRIYTMLGSYYSHKYSHESAKHQKNPKSSPPERSDTERAALYLHRARQVSPNDIAPLNELGYLYVVVTNDNERAAPFLEKSLGLQDDQQRARHLLAIVEHVRGTQELARKRPAEAVGHFAASLTLLTKALQCGRWQATPEPIRYIGALAYNRACALARLAELTAIPGERDGYATAAVDDLEFVFPKGQAPEEQRLADFTGDIKKGGDLEGLSQVAAARDRFRELTNRVLAGGP